MPNFTVKMLDSLPNASPGQRDTYHDDKVRGLSLRVTDKGIKSFFTRKRINGIPKMNTYGQYPDMTIDQARDLARKTLNAFSVGINPKEELKSQKIQNMTLFEVMNDYVVSRNKNLKKKTISDYWTLFNNYLFDWKDKSLKTITRDMVQRKHSLIGKKSIYRANGTMRLLRALFNYASGAYEDANGEPIINSNPVQRISHNKAWYREKTRTNVIHVNDLKNWFKAVNNLSNLGNNQTRINSSSTVSDLLIFVLFTGLRQSEALSLIWKDVDLNNEIFTVRDTKNHTDHTLPITKTIKELLLNRKLKSSGSYVFSGNNPKQALVNPYKQIKVVRNESGINFTLHDLRRTFATVADLLDIQHHIIKRLMNHSNNDVTIKHYVQPTIERLRVPMEKIDAFIVKKSR